MFLSRIFFKSPEVIKSDEILFELPEIKTLDKRAETKKVNLNLEVSCESGLEKLEKVSLKQSEIFNENAIVLNKVKVRRYNKHEIKILRVPEIRQPVIKKSLNRILAIPQERTNKLKYQKKRPQLSPGEMLLACYEPIIEGAVLKLAIDKGRGTLLIWYNHRSKQTKPKGVFLIRRLGLGEKPEWRWL